MFRYMKEHLGIMSQLEDLDELQEWLLQSSALVEEFNSIDPGDSEQVFSLLEMLLLACQVRSCLNW